MSTTPIMRYFDHRPLKEGPERDITKEYMELAQKLDSYLPNGAEKSEALRDLLKSKDSAVRSALDLTKPDQRAEILPDEPNGIDEGGEDYPSAQVEKEEEREKEESRGRSIELHFDSLPEGVNITTNNPHPSRANLSDIELAQVRRLQARRLNGYTY